MSYNIRQNADGSAGLVNSVTATEVWALDIDDHVTITSSSDSTSGSASIEPLKLDSAMTGAGGVGGRFNSTLTVSAALGGWANAIKGYTDFSSGSVTGLGTAVLGEIKLSSNTSSGTYAAIEAEVVMGSSASTGTSSSFIYCNVDDDSDTFNTNGYLFELGSGVNVASNNMVQASAVSGVDSTHAVRVKIAGTDYFIPIHTSSSFA